MEENDYKIKREHHYSSLKYKERSDRIVIFGIVPILVKLSVSNYILFFNDYIRAIKGIDLSFSTACYDNKIRIDFLIPEKHEDKKNELIKEFEKYLLLFKMENADDLEYNSSICTKWDSDILLIDLKQQIKILRNRLQFITALLQTDSDKIKEVKEIEKVWNLLNLLTIK